MGFRFFSLKGFGFNVEILICKGSFLIRNSQLNKTAETCMSLNLTVGLKSLQGLKAIPGKERGKHRINGYMSLSR